MNNEQINEENELMEYIEEEFFDMDIDEQIKYLISNPNVKISPNDVECEYFSDLSKEVLKRGEKELYITILKKYYEAAVELQQEMYYRRARPSFDAIYQYAMHLLNNEITQFEDIEVEVKKMIIGFCILNEYINTCDLDEMIDKYPQLLTFYEHLGEFAYADNDAMYPMMLNSVGKAYQFGTKYFNKDLEKAFLYFDVGASLDYEGRQSEWPFQKVADCLFEVAICYMKGLGVERNIYEALSCFEKAAREYGLNSVPAMAEIYLDDDFLWEEYFDEKLDLIMAAYDAYENYSDELSYLDYDWDYEFEDFDKNKSNKFKNRIIAEIKELANDGNLDAKYRLATAYEQGSFVEQNLELALKYHSELMDEGEYPHSAFFYYENHVPKERESYQLPSELNVGDEFYFGKLIDEPLKWKVVEIHEDGPVVIVEKSLAVLPYGNFGADYEHSYVRQWLNNQFFKKAFTEDEKKHILEEEYYVVSYSGDSYGQKILLKDYLFLPYSSNIASWYGEGKEKWNLLHTDFSSKTGSSNDCWLLDAYDSGCPKHVITNDMNSRFRFHAGCKLGIRPIMIIKKK